MELDRRRTLHCLIIRKTPAKKKKKKIEQNRDKGVP